MADSSIVENLIFPFWTGNESYPPPQYRHPNINNVLPSKTITTSEGQPIIPVQGQTGGNYGLAAKQEEFLTKLDEIISSGSPDELEAWIQSCRLFKINLDIDRISRFALLSSNLPILQYLVKEENANLNQRDVHDRSAIFYLPRCWAHGMYKYISTQLQLKDLNHQDEDRKQTPLHYYTSYGNLDAVEYLLANNAHIDIKDKDNETPLSIMIRCSFYEHMQLLYGFMRLLQEPQKPYILAKLSTFEASMNQKLLEELQGDWRPFRFGGYTDTAWIHVPMMNAIIVFVAIRRLHRVFDFGSEFGSHFYYQFVSSFKNFGAIPTGQRPKFLKPLYESNIEEAKQSNGKTLLQMSIRFPYLRLQTIKRWEQLRKTTNDFQATLTSDLVKGCIRPELTLDETYYPGLSVATIAARNEDQVVFREWAKVQSPGEVVRCEGPILTVPQLWIWRFGDHLVTACPNDDPKESKGRTPRWMTDISKSQEPTGIKIGLAMAHHISQFGNPQADGRFPSPLDIFETGVARVLSDVEQYTNPKKLIPPDVHVERSFMHSIADIREEIAMILEILGQQREIVRDLIRDFEKFEEQDILDPIPNEEGSKWQRREIKEFKDSALEIESQQRRLNKIDRDAERIEKVIQDQLNLKRTYASIRDTRNGLILSAAVIGFTITTIIFAPIAFMASLFALPLDGLLRNQIQSNPSDGAEPTAAYTLTYVGTWFAVAEVVSLVVTGLLVALCLWLFGGLENFSVRRQVRSEESGTRSQINDGGGLDGGGIVTTGGGEEGSKRGERISGLRNRFARFRKQ
ncbi:hypothetical protein F4805DRAFT_50195 [Annulohypoxylon moriforme]|nr:hypothetical protein F4805DRAFT_50195 [Annulohypoxylon moriforme]